MISISVLKDDFETFCQNIQLNREDMDTTICEITKKLNSTYYELDKDTDSHMYVVGSVGRDTAIKSSSDLDLLFDLPNEVYKKYDDYDSNGQSALIQDIKNVLIERYPKTKIRGDGQVVVLEFTNYTVELVPGFKQSDNRFKYPDTHDGESWKYTDPLSEQEECSLSDEKSNSIYSDFCHIIRSWKNEVGFSFKGLLIDTLVYNHFKDNEYYCDSGYSDYLDIFKSLLEYMKSQNKDQSYWYALGSNQKIYNNDNGKFIDKAKKALKKIEESDNIKKTLRELFGSDFPNTGENENASRANYDNTEQFIEDKYPVDIRYNLQIDGIVSQNGWRKYNILNHVSSFCPILRNRKIEFYIVSTNCPKPYSIYWKVRNVGYIAEEKNMIRGQIVKGSDTHTEPTSFYGPHFVECYLIKNDVCVARNRIEVPIGRE